MKRPTKKEPNAYSFEEYKKKFPPPAYSKENEPPSDDLRDLGAKLAEKSLAKVRQQARHS